MDYKSKVKELIEYPREANWYEFKTNWYGGPHWGLVLERENKKI